MPLRRHSVWLATLAITAFSCGGGDAPDVESPTTPVPAPTSPGGFVPPWGGQQTKVPVEGIAAEPSDGTTPGGGEMTFFVTSVGNGAKGGDFGGVAGTDAFCQQLAEKAGAGGKTWAAYVSTASESARGRIGAGPWHNARGEMIASDVDSLHAQGIPASRVIDENGKTIDLKNAHDVLTGSNSDGKFGGKSCRDYASSASTDTVWVGHADGGSVGQEKADSWNAAHASNGCDAVSLQKTASQAHLYCFAK